MGSGDGKTIHWETKLSIRRTAASLYQYSERHNYEFTGYEYDSNTQYNYAIARFEAGHEPTPPTRRHIIAT